MLRSSSCRRRGRLSTETSTSSSLSAAASSSWTATKVHWNDLLATGSGDIELEVDIGGDSDDDVFEGERVCIFDGESP